MKTALSLCNLCLLCFLCVENFCFFLQRFHFKETKSKANATAVGLTAHERKLLKSIALIH